MKEIGAISLFLLLYILVFVWDERNPKWFAIKLALIPFLTYLAIILLW